MNGPKTTNSRFARLRRRLRRAETLSGIGVGLMILVSLLRTAQAVPSARADVLCEWLACAAQVAGWALVWFGMHMGIRAIIAGIERDVWPKRLKNVPADDASLHRAVTALARQSGHPLINQR